MAFSRRPCRCPLRRALHLRGRVDRLQPSVTAHGVRGARAHENNQTNDAECPHGGSLYGSIDCVTPSVFPADDVRQAAGAARTRRAAGGVAASRSVTASPSVSRIAAAPRRTLQLATRLTT